MISLLLSQKTTTPICVSGSFIIHYRIAYTLQPAKCSNNLQPSFSYRFMNPCIYSNKLNHIRLTPLDGHQPVKLAFCFPSPKPTSILLPSSAIDVSHQLIRRQINNIIRKNYQNNNIVFSSNNF